MKLIRFVCTAGLLLLPLSTRAMAQEPAESLIQLQLVDTDIRDALRMVAKQGGINLILSDGVQGDISLELKDVSIQETLEAIISVGGYQFTSSGNIITVTTLTELLERDKLRLEYAAEPIVEHDVLVLELRYVNAERMITVIEKLLGEGGSVSVLKTSDQIEQDYKYRNGSNSGRNSGARSNSNSNSNSNQNSQGGSSSSNLQIGTQLSSSSQGQPAKSHTLVAVDTPERLMRIKKVVERLDIKPPQVLIEARFVEVSLDHTDKLGIDWNMVAKAAGSAAPNTFPFGGSSLGSFDPKVEGGGGNGVFPSAPNSVSTPTEAGLFSFGTLDFTSFSAVLELMRTDSRVQVVSNPRIVVSDRHTATILVGERYPILSANVSDFGSVTEQLDRYEPIGVQLEVTPAVLGDDEVELLVRPSTSSLGALVSGSTGLTVARINSRQIDTSVTVLDNQTVVLGGLFTTRDVDVTSRVPFLSAVPLLGKLFEHQAKTTERVDLVIFLTVTIIQDRGLTAAQKLMFDQASPVEERYSIPAEVPSQLEFSTTGPLLN
jgi:type IV pilus assembly protein PilQ